MRKQRNYRVTIAVQKDLLDQLIIETHTDLISYLYIMIIDIWKTALSTQVKKDRIQERTWKIWIVNYYNNWVKVSCQWQENSLRYRQIIENKNWKQIIERRYLLLENFNTYSIMWNLHIRSSVNADFLETLIERFDLFINNKSDTLTRLKSILEILIIDLVLSNQELGPLLNWAVDQNHSTDSDHKIIVLKWKNIEQSDKKISKFITE